MRTQNIMEQSFALLRSEDYTEAIKSFTKALKTDPDDPFYFMGRGLSKYHTGDYNGSIGDLTKAIELEEGIDIAYYHRCKSHKKTKDYTRALKDINAAIGIRQRVSGYFCERGRLKHLTGDLLGALVDYNRANNKILERAESVYYYRGLLYLEIEAYDMAIDDFKEALWYYPDSAEIYQHRATAKKATGDHEGAREDIAKYEEMVKAGNARWCT